MVRGVARQRCRRSSGKGAVAGPLPSCLSDHAVAIELADDHAASGRNPAAPAALTPERCRSTLEQILSGSTRSDIAARLINEFGSLPRVLAASPERIGQAGGCPNAVEAIRTFNEAMTYALRSRLAARPVISDWRTLLDYMHASSAYRDVERFHVLHLDIRNALIRDEIMSEGTIDRAPVHTREVIRRALELGTSAMILAHNHPSGDPTPSQADIRITREIVAASKQFGIRVHDHLIVGTQGYVSMRSAGLF